MDEWAKAKDGVVPWLACFGRIDICYSSWPEFQVPYPVLATIHSFVQLLSYGNGVWLWCSSYRTWSWGLWSTQQLVLDNGPQFSSVEFATFLARNGVKHIRSFPYHPSTNGLAEHFVHTLKQAMKCSNLPDPHQKLMNFLLSYRSIPHSTTLHQVNCFFTKISELD